LQRSAGVRGARATVALGLHDVQVSIDEGVYELDARLDIELPDAARQAIDSGLTLRLTYGSSSIA
jgi:hypothetical protein